MNHLRNLFPRRVPERRHSIEDSRVSLSAGIEHLIEAWGGGPTNSGQRVNQNTALNLTVVYACIRVLAESVASIPLVVYRRTANGGKERATDHPVYRVLHDRANEDQPSFMWRETIMGHLGLRGNTYSEKEYDNAGRLIGLWPITPDRVQVRRARQVKQFLIEVEGTPRAFTSREILHIPGLGYDGLVGYTPLTVAREAIGLGLAAQEHGARFFSNGANPGGVLEHPGKLGPDALKNLRASWTERHSGTANAYKPAILEEGMKWHQLSVSNRDSQFLETRKFQISEIARIFRIPPHMVGDLERATFSNIEQQSIDFVVHTLRPWLVRIEQVLNWELFDESERAEYFAEFNVEGLLRGDSAARGAFYTQMFNLGALSVNDIREKENMNPVEGGDKRFVPLNMVTLDKAGETPEPPPSPPAEEEKAPAEDEAQRTLVAFQPLVLDVLERALMREATAAKRAAKKGQVGFRSWLNEYQDEQAEYLTRALMPVMQGAARMIGRQLTEQDARFLRGLALGEVQEAVKAYRTIQEPTEDVVAAMLAALKVEDIARDLTERIVSQAVGPQALRNAVGAPVFNFTMPQLNVSPPSVNLDVTMEAPKAGQRKIGTVKRDETTGNATITITDE